MLFCKWVLFYIGDYAYIFNEVLNIAKLEMFEHSNESTSIWNETECNFIQNIFVGEAIMFK